MTTSQNRDAGTKNKINQIGAVVVSHLVEWSLPTPDIRGSNQKIVCTINSIEKTKIKKKEAENGHFFKKRYQIDLKMEK